MNSLDFAEAATAASFIVKTVGPYAAGKIVEGALKEVGKDAYHQVCDRAKGIWDRLKEAFTGESRLSATLQDYEENPDSNEAQENLENDLTTRFRHHPDELTTLVDDLRELLKCLPEVQRTIHAKQEVKNAKDSKVNQIQGNDNTVTNIG
ncbi:MAG: hypothetical protein ISS70_04430 [Phycisphaerae bacterium]|nr:hypothetical protein [Phycisphaerae bacterium]